MTPEHAGRSNPTDHRNRQAPVGTVREYIARINAGDVAGLAELAAAEVRFVDAVGAVHPLTRDAWAAYFSDFPDYRIRVEQVLSDGESVAVFGSASGSFQGKGDSVPGTAWRFPAAWKAIVRAGKLVEWRVYGDVEPMLRSAGHGRFQ
jgi:predicted ester cyclase